MADTVLLQFARAPQAGAVKTRLVPALGEQGAADLHQRLVLHTCETLLASGLGPVQLWVAGDCAHPVFQQCRDMGAGGIRPQQGEDLGARMGHALFTALQCHQQVLLVGSDCPDLDADYLSRALAALSDNDVVLGPALDGGYVLIALRRFDALLMQDIEWGSERVFSQTAERLQSLGWKWDSLPPRADIDRPQDLVLLPESLALPA